MRYELRFYIPEDGLLDSHGSEYMKSYIYIEQFGERKNRTDGPALPFTLRSYCRERERERTYRISWNGSSVLRLPKKGWHLRYYLRVFKSFTPPVSLPTDCWNIYNWLVLNNSPEQTPYWEANSSSAGQENNRVWCNLMVRLPLVYIRVHMNQFLFHISSCCIISLIPLKSVTSCIIRAARFDILISFILFTDHNHTFHMV
jgi:hypothetical protein